MNRISNVTKKMGCSTIIIIVLMICGTVYLLPQFMGGQDSAEPTVNDNSGNDVLQNNSPNIVIGSLVIAEGIDRDGCAVNNVSSLQSANRFYVIAPNSAFPSGTTIFARLYQDGLAIEDLPLITANQDYSGSCISFVFETVNGNNFGIGQYEAEFWVNGNAYNSIRFNVA